MLPPPLPIRLAAGGFLILMPVCIERGLALFLVSRPVAGGARLSRTATRHNQQQHDENQVFQCSALMSL